MLLILLRLFSKIVQFMIPDINIIKLESILTMKECLSFTEKIIYERENMKLAKRKRRIIKKKPIKKKYYLTSQQRKRITEIKHQGFKNGVIASILCISANQVRKNENVMKMIKSKSEIEITEIEEQWILNEAKSESNQILFRADYYYSSFKTRFKNSQLSLRQFRLLLHRLNIRYRVPQLKPLGFFIKQGKNIEVQTFISQICLYASNHYNLIFIDECSLGNISKQTHKQWYLVNTFKQNIHRMSSFRYLIAAIGSKIFLYYQMFSGTGKAYIYYEFISQIIEKAIMHYTDQKFVLIMDNCSIHRATCVKGLLQSVPHIFTPAYRPEFNAIEKLFGWLKRSVVREQPMLSTQFDKKIHEALNLVTSNQLSQWSQSIYKPIVNELKHNYEY